MHVTISIEEEMQTSVSILQNIAASKLYTILDNLKAPRFTTYRLQLSCIGFRFPIIQVRRSRPGVVSFMMSRKIRLKDLITIKGKFDLILAYKAQSADIPARSSMKSSGPRTPWLRNQYAERIRIWLYSSFPFTYCAITDYYTPYKRSPLILPLNNSSPRRIISLNLSIQSYYAQFYVHFPDYYPT
jgi:hypothetical protein